ncbi:TPA: glycosyltransferase family 2 protein [Kluyvera cryocrescens]|nr:glycosyltransferase family 2 protein [Kluyvera cryocrescens]
MKLSIVIPCFNCSENIERLISILQSQLDDFVEVIFINDGSDDNTEDIISEKINELGLKNVYLYNYENAGAAKARERGLHKAKGKYVFFLDSDDYVSKDFVSVIYTSMQNDPDMIYFSSIIVSADAMEIKIGEKISFKENKTYSDYDSFLYYMLTSNNWTSAVWTYVFRRDLAIRSNAIFTDRVAHEDHLFTIRLVSNSSKIDVLNDILYYQRRTKGSLTTSKKNLSYIKERFIAFEEVHCEMKGIFSPESIGLYDKWSVKSFLRLCLDNMDVTWIGVFSMEVYRKIWIYRSIISNLIPRCGYKFKR